MVPPEASACTLWGGMSSCGLSITTIMILDTLVLRSAPHVLRLSRYASRAFELDMNDRRDVTVLDSK